MAQAKGTAMAEKEVSVGGDPEQREGLHGMRRGNVYEHYNQNRAEILGRVE